MEPHIPQPLRVCATSPRPAHLRDLLTRFSVPRPTKRSLQSADGRRDTSTHLHIYTPLHPYTSTPIHIYIHTFAHLYTPTLIHPYTHTSTYPYIYIFTPTSYTWVPLPHTGELYHMPPEYFSWLERNELRFRYMTKEPITPPYPPLRVEPVRRGFCK